MSGPGRALVAEVSFRKDTLYFTGNAPYALCRKRCARSVLNCASLCANAVVSVCGLARAFCVAACTSVLSKGRFGLHPAEQNRDLKPHDLDGFLCELKPAQRPLRPRGRSAPVREQFKANNFTQIGTRLIHNITGGLQFLK